MIIDMYTYRQLGYFGQFYSRTKMTQQLMTYFADNLLESNGMSCTICKDLLKPPVMLVEDHGNICSTCYEENTQLRNLKALHNPVLDTILKILELPCKFKNKETHGSNVIDCKNNCFSLQTLLADLDLVKLLILKNQTFVLRMKMNVDKNKLFYFICNVNDDNNLLYEYSVKHKGVSDNYIKTKARILSSHNIYSFDENISVQVDLEAFKQICHISDTITNIFNIKTADTYSGIDDQMISLFECPVCKNVMRPPIYQCQSGHSICNLCRPRLEKCPTCRSMFGITRNYSLEGLTSGIRYPCIYHDLGCTELSSAPQISKHENECPFKPYSCPFSSCTSTGNRETIIAHLIEFHPESVIFCGINGYTESFRLDQNSLYNKIFDRKCVIAYDHIFRLTCKRVAEHCLWAAEVLGANNNQPVFIYEVDIVDTKRPEKKLIPTDYCLTEMSEDELFKRCILFPNSILSSYSNHGMSSPLV
ncbi:hypothetical protein NQ317_005335 [Molorchus minor]|uniref:RING-type E3 ubiquitin transferase n=1 Tax=Molorchus minor TaxID=1323400 RepID=A0ABQ9JFU5_9CUCU|nr:hypothetical protein NQ317_005335 [Molorchus minor]